MSLANRKGHNRARVRLPRQAEGAIIALLIGMLAVPPSIRAASITDAGGTLLPGDYLFTNITYTGADITTIGFGTNVAVAGPNQFINLSGGSHDALANSLTSNFGNLQTGNAGGDSPIALSQAFTNNNTISVGGSLTLGDFTNWGVLSVQGDLVNTVNIGGNFTNVHGDGTLSGGNYTIDSGGTLAYTGSDIKTIGAGTILTLANTQNAVTGQVLNLAGGSHDALVNSLADNFGQLLVQQNAVAALNADFTNHSVLRANLGGQLTLGGIFNNIDGNGLLSVGNYDLGSGSSVIYTGADIQTIGSGTVLALDSRGGTTTGQFVNTLGGNHDAVSDSLTDNSGAIVVNNGAQLTLNRNFTNEGQIVTNSGSITLNGGLSNVQGGTLTGGTYLIGGGSSLTYDGADIQAIGSNTSLTLANNDVLSLATGQFLNLAGGSHDALSGSLTDNFGNLRLSVSASLTLSQSFTNHDGATVILGGGTLTTAGLNNQAGATIDFFGAGAVHSTGAASNAGTIIFEVNNTVSSDGDFTNSADSLNVVQQGKLATGGSLINTGGLTIGDGGSGGLVTAQTGVQQSGILDIQADGELDLAPGATFTQTAGNTTVDGTLDPQTIDIFGGTLDGTGSVFGDVFADQTGIVAPGDGGALGTLTINGSYTQQSGGELDIVIAGYAQGSEYSFLTVNGAASLGGYLNLSSFGGFNLLAGDMFTVLEASSLNGTFSSSSWNNLTPGLTYSLFYENDDVEVVVANAPEPGTLALFGGAIALAGLWRRQRRKTQRPA